MKVVSKIFDIWPKRWIATALVVLCILYLTLVPRPLPDNDIDIPGLDKVVHAIMFGGLAWVACIDLARVKRRCFRKLSRVQLLKVAVAVALFGGAIEVAQQLMAMGRGGDILDFLADVAGTIIGTLIAARMLRQSEMDNKG